MEAQNQKEPVTSTLNIGSETIDSDFSVIQGNSGNSDEITGITSEEGNKVMKEKYNVKQLMKIELFKENKRHTIDPFNVEFEESKEISTLTETQAKSDELSQKTNESDITNFEKVNLFKIRKKNESYTFDDSVHETSQKSAEESPRRSNMNISLQKPDEVPSQDSSSNFRKPVLFEKQNKKLKSDFEIRFEESNLSLSQISSQGSQDSRPSQSFNKTSSQNMKMTKRKPKLFKKKKVIKNAFDIGFEQSGLSISEDISQSCQESQPSVMSQSLSKTLSQDSTRNKRNSELFKKKKKEVINAFNVVFEKSEICTFEESTQKSSKSQPQQLLSQDSVTSVSQELSLHHKPRPFSGQKRLENDAFNVDFDESEDILTPDSPKSITESSVLFKNRRKNAKNDFDVGFEESKSLCVSNTSLIETESKVVPFSTTNRIRKSFDISSDEMNLPSSANASSVVSNRSNLFFKKPRKGDDSFDVPLSKSLDISKDSEEKKGSDSLCGIRSNTTDINCSNGASPVPKSIETGDFVIEKSITNNLDTKTSSSKSFFQSSKTSGMDVSDVLNESSFNDDNLNLWMSDHSQDEIAEYSKLEPENIPEGSPLQEKFILSRTNEDLERHFELKLKEIIEDARKGPPVRNYSERSKLIEKPKSHKEKSLVQNKIYEKTRPVKPSPFVTQRLYDYIIKKIKPEYGIDSIIEAQEIVLNICHTVKTVTRRKTYQKKLIHELKVDLAKHKIIETTFDFYEFVRNFLPYDFRVKVVPCIQPVTNIVYPPKDAKNPFDKIL